MTQLLSITAHPDTPVACDMTGAQDTPTDRLAEYRRLFDHALLGRTSTDTATTFRLAARPGVRGWVLDLVRREAACCPFLSYVVHLDNDQVVWTTRGLGASDMALLDEFLTGAHARETNPNAIAEQLEARGGIPSSCRPSGDTADPASRVSGSDNPGPSRGRPPRGHSAGNRRSAAGGRTPNRNSPLHIRRGPGPRRPARPGCRWAGDGRSGPR